jgi:hypothetical protein
MARPRTSDDERRSEFLVLRLTPAERLTLVAEAERLSLTLTELCRQRVVKGRVVVHEHRQLAQRHIFELGKIGVNLNQIARALNERQNLNPATIESAIDELKTLIAGLLIGDPGARAGGPGSSPENSEPAPRRPETRPGGDATKPHRGVPGGS